MSSRSSYNLTFDASLLEKDEDANESLLRLLQLCQSRGINWVDSLPISRSAPFAYTIDSLDSAARSRFLTYLKDLDEAANALAAYLLEHPALLETTDEEGNRENPADDILADEELDQAGKAQALLEELTSSQHPLLRAGVRDDLRGAYPGVSRKNQRQCGKGGPGRGI